MSFSGILGVIGSIASIVSIIGAFISWINSKNAKKYSEIYYTTDTKEKLQTVFVRLESIQESVYKLNHSGKRGFKISNELREYEEIRKKLDSLITIIPSKYSQIVSRLIALKETVDVLIQKDQIIDSEDLMTFKTAITLAIGEVKTELEDLRKDLVNLTAD